MLISYPNPKMGRGEIDYPDATMADDEGYDTDHSSMKIIRSVLVHIMHADMSCAML